MDINLLLILIRQMAALVRHALMEVCTDPVVLVVIYIFVSQFCDSLTFYRFILV